MGRVNHVKEENVKVEEIEELLRKCASGKKQDSEVSRCNTLTSFDYCDFFLHPYCVIFHFRFAT